MVWSNCLDSVEDSFSYNSDEKKALNFTVTNVVNTNANSEVRKPIELSLNLSPKPTEKIEVSFQPTASASPPDNTDIAFLIESNDNFILENLIFDLGDSKIKPEAEKDLNELAKIMMSRPTMKILLEGHTDRRGSAKKNLKLSEDRVKSTKEYLVKQGVSTNNIDTKGWAKLKPFIITKDIEKAKINRRVEIQILSR